jgi:hypothetical protein
MSILQDSRTRNLLTAFTLSLLLSVIGATRVSAQEPPLGVLVEQIAGTSIYLRAGTDDGISVNDTLLVLEDSGDRTIGALLVMSATTSRSVVSFLDDPFPLTRGTMLSIRMGAGAAIAAPPRETPSVEPGQQGRLPVTAPRSYPQVSGRLSFQLNALESTTKWQSNEEVSVGRQFATPSMGLRLNVSDLPGGIEFTSNVRGSYRYSSDDLVQPAHSARVYQMGIEKSFEAIPVQFQVGRFYNRYESFSGYWDGVLLHYGNRGLGFGFAAGFDPDRANEGLSFDIPKYTAFVDFNHVGDGVAYYSDLSFHQLLPRDAIANQTSLGWSQRLTLRRTRLGTDVQVHRDPETNSWSMTRLHTNGAVPLTRRVSLLARYAFDRPDYRFYSPGLFSYERQQASVGLRYWDRGGNASLHVTTNKFNEGDLSYSVSSSFGLTRTPLMDLGFHAAGTIWLMESTRVVDLLAGVDRAFGRVQSRASYRFYQTVGANTTLLSHTVDAAFIFPLGQRVYSTLNGRLQRGRNQTASSIFVSLWTSF